jgi:signal transduction histidine kinase
MTLRLRISGGAITTLVCVVLLTVGESQVWLSWSDGGVGDVPTGHRLVRAALVVAFVAPLGWLRRRPLPAALVICGAITVQLLAVAPYVPFLAGLLPMAVANYGAAAYGSRWRSLSLAAVFATEVVMYARIPEERATGEMLFGTFVALGTWAAGDVVRARLKRADRALSVAHTLVAEQEEVTAAALADERARIARELHDIIAHSVSVMGVQAGAARALMDSDSQAAREALRAIEATARSSVGELRRLLTVLRTDDTATDSRAPQPGLAQLASLVDQVRAAGLPVDVTTNGVVGGLPPGVDLAAYRIVQEALTNALKHAGTPTAVEVIRHHGQVHVEVSNTGPARPRNGRRGSAGHGLIGMRERVQLYGGTFDAGPSPDGGFVVRAALPVAADVVMEPAQ